MVVGSSRSRSGGAVKVAVVGVVGVVVGVVIVIVIVIGVGGVVGRRGARSVVSERLGGWGFSVLGFKPCGF